MRVCNRMRRPSEALAEMLEPRLLLAAQFGSAFNPSTDSPLQASLTAVTAGDGVGGGALWALSTFASLADDGTLTVNGTEAADELSFVFRGAELWVTRNDTRATFARAGVLRIEIDGFGGDDRIDWMGIDLPVSLRAGGGNDVITAGSGSDTVLGGDGNDKIHGGEEYDLLSGNAGNDQIDGGLGNDRLNGDGGNDKLYGGAGLDRLFGYAGRDYLDGGSSGDRLDGGDGVDNLFGQGGDDGFYTQDNDGDAIFGGSGHDFGIVVDLQDARFSIEDVTLPRIAKSDIAVLLEDYATPPLSSKAATINFAGQLGRVNFLRSEPAGASGAGGRFFVADSNRNLYLLDRTSKTLTQYLNFQDIFPKFDNDPGFAAGLVTFAFDPEYATNGIFYTVHTEDPSIVGSAVPVSFPGFSNIGYTTTSPENPPAGIVAREGVLVEWKDTNIANATFEGAAREILRVGFNANFHPMGDLIFNPIAQPGDADYRNLYIANGDGRAGESADVSVHPIPQRLDALQGKILRITLDLSLRTSTSTISANGRYRIPSGGTDANPFTTIAGARGEVFAYGLRNPHRMTWDATSNNLIVSDIGLGAWEEINIIHKGGNYGYGEREGTEQLFVGGPDDQKTGGQTDPPTPFPVIDTLSVTGLGDVIPLYPVAQYRTNFEGDAISSGFVYRGTLMPELRGKFIFGEITTGRILYCDLAELVKADDADRTTLAPIHELQVLYDSPRKTGGFEDRRVFDVVAESYAARGGDPRPDSSDGVLPGAGLVTGGWIDGTFVSGVGDGAGVPYGGGRADVRLAVDGDGELYLLSKSDGAIRKLVGSQMV